VIWHLERWLERADVRDEPLPERRLLRAAAQLRRARRQRRRVRVRRIFVAVDRAVDRGKELGVGQEVRARRREPGDVA
jgi:hypothetical protein